VLEVKAFRIKSHAGIRVEISLCSNCHFQRQLHIRRISVKNLRIGQGLFISYGCYYREKDVEFNYKEFNLHFAETF
jgi:hypothetical protein